MGDGATANELKHINKSLSGLHRKADLTNGAIGDHSNRLTALETRGPTYVTREDCAESRGSNWKRAMFLVIGGLVAALVGAVAPHLIGGGP